MSNPCDGNHKVVIQPYDEDGDPGTMSQTISQVNALEVLLRQSDCPSIAVSFSDVVSDADLVDAKDDGLDVAELRIDRFGSHGVDHVVGHVRRFAAFPTIATIRTEAEGGEWTGLDADRLELFRAVMAEVDGIDIELSSSSILPEVVDAAKALDKVVIISNHNFDHTPSELELLAMATEAKALGADLVKLSAMAKSFADLTTLAEFTIHHAHLGLIVIAMGAHGSLSRVQFPAFGSRLTYAWSSGKPVSGQLKFDETFDALRRFYPAFNEKKIVELQIIEP